VTLFTHGNRSEHTFYSGAWRCQICGIHRGGKVVLQVDRRTDDQHPSTVCNLHQQHCSTLTAAEMLT